MSPSSFYNIYLCSYDEQRFPGASKPIQFAGHNIADLGKKKIIWPRKLNPTYVSPKNFVELKEGVDMQDVLIVDRLKNVARMVSVVGHVNRAGISFLRGKTPIENAQQFPDMSNIYSRIESLPKTTVHTLGPENFNSVPSEQGIIWSEAVGLISVVAHYAGINVSAVGAEDSGLGNELMRKLIAKE